MVDAHSSTCHPTHAAFTCKRHALERFFFQSRDLLSALSPFLTIDDVLQCSSLSTDLYAWSDGDATWAPRLTQATVIPSPPASADASSARSDATPIGAHLPEPLPLADAMDVIEQFLRSRQSSRWWTVVFDGVSGMYHVHYTQPTPVDERRALHILINYDTLR